MQLPDFLDFDAFNELRDRMGADKLGYFEVFDPRRHLTGEERSDLRTHGVTVRREQLFFLGDHTLAYKNSRVGVVVGKVLHVTRCKHLSNFVEGLAVGDDAPIAEDIIACRECLHLLRFEGIDLEKERKHHHNEKIIAQFRLALFYETYADYPLYERQHVRHPL
ncbi:hypothetical protein NFC81_05525 [Salinispirillum sp. LH 10-3-1]|uniref:Uncharacterized protein n=1 Tax=Salinispirillum sp. LH 10-3-1 TaxID=2952525 RepID=A0AB38YIK1_9GAMM